MVEGTRPRRHAQQRLIVAETRSAHERGKDYAKHGGKPLQMSSVYKIFHDPAYSGEFLYIDPDTQEKKLWPGSYEPMVSKIEFAEAQENPGPYYQVNDCFAAGQDNTTRP